MYVAILIARQVALYSTTKPGHQSSTLIDCQRCFALS